MKNTLEHFQHMSKDLSQTNAQKNGKKVQFQISTCGREMHFWMDIVNIARILHGEGQIGTNTGQTVEKNGRDLKFTSDLLAFDIKRNWNNTEICINANYYRK